MAGRSGNAKFFDDTNPVGFRTTTARIQEFFQGLGLIESVSTIAYNRPALTAKVSSASLLDAVREAMDIKQAVENRLFADGVITAHEEEIGAMIGETVRTMVEETERLALTENGEISRVAAERFHKAAETLRRAYADIDVILDPVPENLRLPAENDALSRASERLDEKLQQARGVRRHLERGMVKPDVEASPSAEPSNHHPEKSRALEG